MLTAAAIQEAAWRHDLKILVSDKKREGKDEAREIEREKYEKR